MMLMLVLKSIKDYSIDIEKAPISISAFLNESITEEILNSKSLTKYDLILLPGHYIA